MLKITIPGQELWDEEKEEFVNSKSTTISLEHSLISLAKWESKWHKPFLDKGDKTPEEIVDYIKCMTLTQNVNPEVYGLIDDNLIKQITDYIEDPMTAVKTISAETNNNKSSYFREVITAEIIYCDMIALQIPFECEKWHLNRLITLIRVCNARNQPNKKRTKKEIARETAEINAARRKAAKEAREAKTNNNEKR